MDATSAITSIGCAASQLQRPVAKLAEAAKALGVTPASIINGIVYFAETDVERISEYLRSERRPEMDAR